MKKKMIVISVFIGIISADAQTKSDSLKGKFPLKKNEFSINTAPVLRQILTNGNDPNTRFSIAYKRYLNEKSALRFSIIADMISSDEFNHRDIPGREIILLNSDSMMIRQETVNPSFISPHLNIGYERLFGKGKLKWFYGADLIFGYSESQSFRQNVTLSRDSLHGEYGWVESNYRPEIVSRTHIRTVSVGVSPFFGAKYPISKRFSISAQVSADAVFRDQRVSERGPGVNSHQHISTFDFNGDGGFLNDISLIYKF